MRHFERTKIDLEIRFRVRRKALLRRGREKADTWHEPDFGPAGARPALGARRLQPMQRLEPIATAICTAFIAHVFIAFIHIGLVIRAGTPEEPGSLPL